MELVNTEVSCWGTRGWIAGSYNMFPVWALPQYRKRSATIRKTSTTELDCCACHQSVCRTTTACEAHVNQQCICRLWPFVCVRALRVLAAVVQTVRDGGWKTNSDRQAAFSNTVPLPCVASSAVNKCRCQ